MAISIWSAAAC